MPIDRSMPILIVEGRRTFATLIEGMLRRAKFENVESAYDGASALGMLHRAGPRVVIADLNVEPISGLEMLQNVRADQQLAHCPFLITCEGLNPYEATRLKTAGVDGVLIKPFRRDVLEPKLTMAFERRRRLRPAPEVTYTSRPRNTGLGRRLLFTARN
jgi:two-component system chemotaxis response regulator CheY